jgi:rare lipoprotein A
MMVAAFALGCASSRPAAKVALEPDALHGIASWYGQEFAGRTTANGEIFDPLFLSAAHRTLPFGTVVDVTNVGSGKTVRVRINDRGPFVGNRVIDLSYAAASQIDLVEPGSGEVDLKVVELGRGDREPPAPYVVSIPAPTQVVSGSEPPRIDFPLPGGVGEVKPQPGSADDFHVEVVEEHKGSVPTRKTVAADGRTITEVPVDGSAPATTVSPAPAPPAPAVQKPSAPGSASKASVGRQFVVQVGAFHQEANAGALQQKLAAIGQKSVVDRNGGLFRVRIGPFPSRDLAIRARSELEQAGVSAIVVPE